MNLTTVAKRERKALVRAAKAGGRIYYLHGGFWISPRTTLERTGKGWRPVIGLGKTPEDHFTTLPTIRRLERLGHLVRTNEYYCEWRDTRRLTTLGWETAADLTGEDREYAIQARAIRTVRA